MGPVFPPVMAEYGDRELLYSYFRVDETQIYGGKGLPRDERGMLQAYFAAMFGFVFICKNIFWATQQNYLIR